MQRILVYSHDTFGLGNIRRMLEVARHLVQSSPEVSVLVVTGQGRRGGTGVIRASVHEWLQGPALSAEARAASQARLASLKIHPRDTLHNRTLLARLERAWMQTLGTEREQIGQWLDEFQSVLGAQQEQPITAARQRLEQALDALFE